MSLEGQETEGNLGQTEKSENKKENLSKGTKEELIRALGENEKFTGDVLNSLKTDFRGLYVGKPNGKNYINDTFKDIERAKDQARKLILSLEDAERKLEDINTIEY